MTQQTLYRRDYLLHLQNRTAYDEPILLKEPAHEQLNSSQIAHLHNEYVITKQLSGVPGVRSVYALEGSESHPVLLLQFIQGNSLSKFIQSQSQDLSQRLRLAVEIAGVIERVHEAGVMHRDICGSNILIAQNAAPGDPGWVSIIDFGLALTMRQDEHPQPVFAETRAGTLAYISPEQTGRINHPVDFRTDLYSLGITLYELLVNQLPFEAEDPLEMIHCHLAQNPKPLNEINDNIPQILSDIILKLLVKDPNGRYLSARSLVSDLAECLHQLQTTGNITSFELDRDDYREQLVLPNTLYGRESQKSQLIATYERVAQGNTELLFVTGYSGVGKTSLVHEIQREIVSKGGTFIEGKFDQHQRTQPYSAWAQAFTQLFNNWLSESESILLSWQETILNAVGDHGQILIDVIPALEHIIGLQPKVAQLGSIENQIRFNYYFDRFITSLASADHPLVVFLDDLQWVDQASLNLIEALMTAENTGCCLILGAYRDNEVGSDHLLVASQDRIHNVTDQISFITLRDLMINDINHLLADTLQLTIVECRDLGQVLLDRTAGNPFYLRHQLYALESDGFLRFDWIKQRWLWADTLPQGLQTSGSVVDLMIAKIQALPIETQRSLSIAACIGNHFEMSTLSIVTGQPQTDILTDLNPALQHGLIVRSDGHYLFAHDRVQEVGYALIPKSDLPKRHLDIGRLLLANTPEEYLKEGLFDIVNHLNTGRELIDKVAEKTELALLNLMAGQKAKTASAYADAKKYIEIGLELLELDSWKKQYELTLSLHNENGDLAYLTGQFDQLAPTVDLIQNNTRDIFDQVQIYMTQIEAETAQYNVAKALEIGLKVLRDLGFEISVQPTAEDYQGLKDKFTSLLASKPLKQIANLPKMVDERALAASSLFASIMSTSYIINPPLFPIISYNGAIMILEYGLDVWAPFFFGGVTLVNFALVDMETPVDEALDMIRYYQQLVDVIYELLDNPVTARSRSKGLMMLAFNLPWIEPIEQSIEISQTTFNSGFETGDWLYASYGTIFYSVLGFDSGMNLASYEKKLSAYINNVHRMGYITPAQYASIFLQTGFNFKEVSQEPHKLKGIYFDEDKWLPAAITINDMNGRHYFYTSKLILGYHFDVEEKLNEYTDKAEDFLAAGQGIYSTTLCHLFIALAKIRLVSRRRSKKHPEAISVINQSLHWLAIWSQSAPTTFQHKYDLIAAEKARVLGDLDGALTHYEQAINGAQENGFTHEEALANELYARFWLERGNERLASLFMREAHSLYRKWGAMAKAEHLAKRYPKLIIGRSIFTGEPQTQITTDRISGDLDLMTVLKASQTIATEIELDRLLEKLLAIATENSGAQRGFLLLPEAGQWIIVSQSSMDKPDQQVIQSIPVADSDLLSQRIVQYVSRTQQTVFLENAFQSGDFVDDPYVQHNEVKSLLCVALVDRGKTNAILYLENNLSPGIFTSERVTLLQLLSSQMAISIDNARTHTQLEKLFEERSRALSSAEAQIRSMFDNSPLGIALSSYEGEFLSANQAFLDMLCISEEQMFQQKVTDFYADPGQRDALLVEVQESRSIQEFGVQLIRQDGSLFFASLNISRLTMNGEEVLLAIVEDVTDELKTEQEIATLEERERLARDLHDAVSQTLFTAGMIADATPRLWDKDPATGKQNLELLLTLIRGASAEMRSLLLELRPDTLQDQTLGKLLETLATAARSRTQATVSLLVERDHLLPQDVTITLHRIAQEALNNIAKHAEAAEVVITLRCDPNNVTLSIKDDGGGFDPEVIPAGHLGIGIIRERAQKIGAIFQITSKPGQGTSVVVTWSEDGGKG